MNCGIQSANVTLKKFLLVFTLVISMRTLADTTPIRVFDCKLSLFRNGTYINSVETYLQTEFGVGVKDVFIDHVHYASLYGIGDHVEILIKGADFMNTYSRTPINSYEEFSSELVMEGKRIVVLCKQRKV